MSKFSRKHSKYPKNVKTTYLKKSSAPTKKEWSLICGKKGYLANKCPQKYKKPCLVALFINDLDPTWWDLDIFEVGHYPKGEVHFLPDDPGASTPPYYSSSLDSPEFDQESPKLGGWDLASFSLA